MANTPSVQYGIATDGNELVIINKDLEEIDEYEPFMLDEDQFCILGVAIGIIKN